MSEAIDIDSLTLGQIKQLQALLGAAQPAPSAPHPDVGKDVIIRSRDSGVHVGRLIAADGRRYRIIGSRIWRWRGAHTLSELALHGTSDTGYTRIAEAVELTVEDACECIPVTEVALASLTPRWAK